MSTRTNTTVRRDFEIARGDTFSPTIYWSDPELISKAITGITKAAPAVISSASHGLTDGWRAAVVSAGGMSQINATDYPPRGADWHAVTVLTSGTVAFNDVSSGDYSAYTSGGFLVYETPRSLSGVTASMKFFESADRTGTPLVTLTELSGLTLSDVAHTIVPRLETAGVTWTQAYFELSVTDTASKVTQVLFGSLILQ